MGGQLRAPFDTQGQGLRQDARLGVDFPLAAVFMGRRIVETCGRAPRPLALMRSGITRRPGHTTDLAFEVRLVNELVRLPAQFVSDHGRLRL
jgi:hypothetical protein